MHGKHKLVPQLLRGAVLGLSLVELMVAITIGLLLLLAMTALLSQQNRARDELGKSAAQNENGRYALMLLKGELQHAGYFGQFDGTGPVPALLPNPCAVTAAAIEEAMGLPVQAYDSLGAVPVPLSNCLADANHLAGTDILVVRRLHTGAPSINPGALAAQPNRMFAQTTPLERVVDLGANNASFTLLQKDLATPAEIRPVLVHIYFVSPCDVLAAGQAVCTAAADGGSPIPTLKRLELGVSGAATAFVLTPLVQGIEDLQFDYGIDVDGNGSPSTPFVTAPTLAQLPDVVAIKINLLARSTEPTRGYTDTKIYNMGVTGDLDAFDDEFKRHVYSTTVRLNNPSGRRE